MPLIKSKNKKSFEKNVKTEVDSGKPLDQSLAISYSIKRKSPKKMATGGQVRDPKEPQTESMEQALKRQQEEIDYSQGKLEEASEMPKFAKGGKIPTTPRMAESSVIKASAVDALGRKIPTMEEMYPQHHEGMSTDKRPAEEEFMSDEMEPQYAEGGMIDDMEQPEEEAAEERHSSIAAAIMSKKAKMMAEGGQVDIDDNNNEEPNAYYQLNKDALKENYDEDFESLTQPMDSNEHGDEIEADAHDMISRIRSKMKSKRA